MRVRRTPEGIDIAAARAAVKKLRKTYGRIDRHLRVLSAGLDDRSRGETYLAIHEELSDVVDLTNEMVEAVQVSAKVTP